MAGMRRAFPLLALLLAACSWFSRAPIATTTGLTVLLVHDDGRTEGALTFPSTQHESVVRFELPPGEHKLRRLWLQATAAGTLRWAIYEQTPMEGPGPLLDEGTLVVPTKAISNGKDGLWVYQDLSALSARQGVIWLGLKRADGEPAIATSRVDAGNYFMRSFDPTNPLNLMPVRRTPLVRLEIDP
jgi:hypothetical protein